ncbi:SIRT4 [Ramazzottius varieornatus]|uniref:SIRT4 n=1 Tax=Ramazzottius varieornatus TaxID=947166 RepID=A0A1D1UY65_RAMVA|nr:SIRT4 [Ramazzottius varieornatus]
MAAQPALKSSLHSQLYRAVHTLVAAASRSDPSPPPSLQFVPTHVSARHDDAARLSDFIFSKKKLVCLTGAGISTESGIPDYRGEGVGLYATSRKKPMQFADFMASDRFRQSFWARNYVGWNSFNQVQPNMTHVFLANLEKRHDKVLHWLITQNVDGLHIKAGSRRITELHGTSFQTHCLSCGYMISRKTFQEHLREANPSFHAVSLAIRPDADVELTTEQVSSFNVPPCRKCQKGIMKPYIVYFGENVPKERVAFLYRMVEESDGLLVLGSSMQVYSGYRFAVSAAQQKKPIAIVNIGSTRADHLANLKLDNVRCADVLSFINIDSNSV